jgi:hypothetical protein
VNSLDEETQDAWNESDMLIRWPPEFLDIVGKHSRYWNHPKGETLLRIDEWINDKYMTEEAWEEKALKAGWTKPDPTRVLGDE